MTFAAADRVLDLDSPGRRGLLEAQKGSGSRIHDGEGSAFEDADGRLCACTPAVREPRRRRSVHALLARQDDVPARQLPAKHYTPGR
jgi:hypothetical protein